jgi:hypothetical protein
MLRRTHGFLTDRPHADVEVAADRFFRAVGYVRRPEGPGTPRGTIIFQRGRRLAGLYSPRLRDARTSLAVRPNGASVHLDYEVDTFGHLSRGRHRRFFELEARNFERFLVSADTDVAAVARDEVEASASRAPRVVAFAIFALGVISVAAALVLAISAR